MIVVGVLFLVLILLISKPWRSRKIAKIHSKLGIDYVAMPLIGHLHKFIGTEEDRMNLYQQLAHYAYSNKYGASSILVGPFLTTFISDPDQALTIFKKSNSKGLVTKIAQRAVGNSLPFATVKIWQPRRKILLPSFSSKHLAQFVRIFESQNKMVVKSLKDKVGNGNLSIWNYLSLYSLDSICETAFGINLKIQNQTYHPLFHAFSQYVNYAAPQMFHPWLCFDTIYNMLPLSKELNRLKLIMYGFVDDLIQKKQAMMSGGATSTEELGGAEPSRVAMECFLESMIKMSEENGRKYSIEELRDEVLTLALAGSDTTATGTCFTVTLLSQHPDVQEKVYQEILEVLDVDKQIEMGDLQKLKYLDAVIKESLRLYPPIPIISRYSKQEIQLHSDLVMPRKQTYVINIWGINHNPHTWGADTEEFNPDRFISRPQPTAGAFMSFSFGQRNCIGYQYALLSMKTTIVTLLKNYRLKPATSFTYGKDNPLRMTCDVMSRHVNNFEIKIEKRSS